jgi:hypothetical protein
MKRFITLDINKKIIGIRQGTTVVDGETESKLGEIGQIQQEDGTFIDAPVVPIAPQPYNPTNTEIAQMISDLQADLIIAGVI